MTKNMTNAEIYGLSRALNSAFNMDEKYLPARVNFFISKNKNTISKLSELIDESRANIIKYYGIDNGDGTVQVPGDKIEAANKELIELLNLSHEVDISMIHLSDLDGLEFTSAQMQALLFMIEED
jgi:hypothetical protein